MRKLLLFVMVLGLLLIQNVWAGDCDRCGSKIVCPGLTKWEVIQICGNPDYSERYFSKAGSIGVFANEVLFYNNGPMSFVRIFTFQGGVLVNVSVGGYGWSR